MPGIDNVERDTFLDDDKMRSAGFRLVYTPRTTALAGVKDGILLELGFDDTAPNRQVTISSWALNDPVQRERFAREYRKTSALYYQGQPDFELLVARIRQNILTM